MSSVISWELNSQLNCDGKIITGGITGGFKNTVNMAPNLNYQEEKH